MLFHKQQKQPNMSAEDCCVQGKMSYNAGKYLEAMEFFQAAIEKDSKKGEAYTSLIDTYRILGREHDAQKTLKKLQIEIPNYSPESQTAKAAPPKQKKTSPKQKPTITPPAPSKPKKSFWEIVFGKPIELTTKDRKSIVAGIIFEILVLFVALFLGLDVGVALLLNLFVIFIYGVVAMVITGNTWSRNNPGSGVSYACLIGISISAFVSAFFDDVFGPVPFELIIFFLSNFTILYYLIGRFKKNKKNQGRLFGYTSAAIRFLLIIICCIPLIEKRKEIHKYEMVCEESLKLRNEHKQQSMGLGFMGVNLNDSYTDVVKQLKNNTNVIGPITNYKTPCSDFDFVNIDDYNNLFYSKCQVLSVNFDQGFQCNISFDNETYKLSLFFWNDSLKYIHFNGGKEGLYKQKYGNPEYYYTLPPELLITRTNKYPYYGNGHSSKIYLNDNERQNHITQWTYANGVIRVYNSSSMYMSNDVVDTLAAMNERAIRQAEQLRLEQEERERLLKLEEERQEKEAAEKRALEQQQIENRHKQALDQI